MSNEPTAHRVLPSPPPIGALTLQSFLENTPPGTWAYVQNALTQVRNISPPVHKLRAIDIQLHCDTCNGFRTFQELEDEFEFVDNEDGELGIFLRFVCRNCRKGKKTYSVVAKFAQEGLSMVKLGEMPQFGVPNPSRLISLIRDEKEYFAKGRRCENQGLGIAAFAYYRRVVENQRTRIFEGVIRASLKLGAPSEFIAELESAKAETQFSKAMGVIRSAMPQALLLDGHNPLLLLHNALSEGLHAQTDEECLKMATAIRVVLAELVERIATVLADHAELKGALTSLMAVKAKKPPTV